jgi:hypothetical protein
MSIANLEIAGARYVSITFDRSRGFGWRIHCSIEVTELSTNKEHTLSLSLL